MSDPYYPTGEMILAQLSGSSKATKYCYACFNGNYTYSYKEVEVVVTDSKSLIDIEGYYVQDINGLYVPKHKCWHVSQIWCPDCGLMYKPNTHKFVTK